MSDLIHVLVVSGDPEVAEHARQCVSESQPPVALQWLRDAGVALARVGGGDIDILVIDPAASGDYGLKDWLERLRRSCQRTQAIVVSGSRNWTADLRRLVAASRQIGISGAHPAPHRRPKSIGFMGAIGGVGATTVALNIAFALAAKRTAVLAELCAGNDTLMLRIRTTAQTAWPAGAALRGLWSVKGMANLSIALAEDMSAPEAVAGELEDLGAEADYLVFDLGSNLTPAVKCALPQVDALGLVVDMELLSIECAKRVVDILRRPELCPRGPIGVVVVIRASLACPVNLDEVQRQIGLPVWGCVSPAGDLCNAAQKARRPIVTFEPESLAAQSLEQLASSIAELT